MNSLEKLAGDGRVACVFKKSFLTAGADCPKTREIVSGRAYGSGNVAASRAAQHRGRAILQQLANGRTVAGDHRRAHRQRLKHLIRDHHRGLRRVAKNAKAHMTGAQAFDQRVSLEPWNPFKARRSRASDRLPDRVFQLAATHDRELNRLILQLLDCFENRREAVERRKLRVEQHTKWITSRWRPLGPLPDRCRAYENPMDF